MKALLKPICSILLLVIAVQAQSQESTSSSFDKLVDILPPAPNAAAIIKYGEASINKNTGTPNISIPLYTLKGNKLATSVSLGYSSSGIRVDEIASRTGMGWALNAGGVITCTVRGIPDFSGVRHTPPSPIDVNYNTWNYMYEITQTNEGAAGNYDSEPDLFNFSFDGNSGSFVLDDNMNPVLIAQNGFKVATNFGSNDWNFKITNTEGVVYIFGGNTATESTKRTSSCGKACFGAYTDNAWYLKQIVHPNGEVINFTYSALEYDYDNGVVQTMYSPWVTVGGCSIPNINTSTCINTTKTKGVLLQSISIPGTAAIYFSYTNRLDCNDKLVNAITYKDPVNTVGYFQLNYTTYSSNSAYDNLTATGYNKTPYLTSLDEKSANGAFTKTHLFNYVDPTGRCSRLSYSQDHWGYFNGSVNSSFTPLLSGPGYEFSQTMFPAGTANREPSFAYTQKGLLQKVVYPTGGASTLMYEANVVEDPAIFYSSKHTLSCDVTGSGDWNMEYREKSFHTGASPMCKLHIECKANGDIVFPYDRHVKGQIQIGSSYSKEFSPGYTGDEILYIPDDPNLKITLRAYGTLVTMKATLEFTGPSITSTVTQRAVSGARVAKIATANPGEQPIIKKYFYGPLDDMTHSSLYYPVMPQYRGTYKQTFYCAVEEKNITYTYETLSASSLSNLGVYNNSPVSYAAVVESNGENFEGGGTETKFYTGIDMPGQVVWNSPINNSTLSNFSSLENGRPYTETVLKKMADNSLKPMKKTSYTYYNDPATQRIIYGYAVNRSFPEASLPSNCDVSTGGTGTGSCYWIISQLMSKYNMMRYHIISSRITPQTTVQTLWDENGENPVVSTTNSYYENALHYQLTKSETVNSKGQTILNTFKYPHDYTGTGDYTAMVNNNIISPVVSAKTEIVEGSTVTPVNEAKTTYSNVGSNNFEPVSIALSTKGGAFETEGTIELYDSYGHILQYKGKNGMVNSIIWGYNNLYPVAKIANATYAQAIAQLTGTVSALQSLDGSALRNEINHIRTGLPTALVSTYTYKHLAGVSSITDANNKINTYEYDDFNRLLVVKDQDGNAVKKNEYVYTTPSLSSGVTIYYNTIQSASFVCTTCNDGFTGTSTSFSVPAGKYFSLISQADADALAMADVNLNGPINANKNGSCSNAIQCTGTGYKFVSCGCELGVKVCENTVNNNNGTYNISYRYHYSDFSYGDLITEVISCTGANNKMLNCKCEAAVKVCENVVNNNNGTYTVTYHYAWSDASTTSPSVTETIACSGPDKKLINCTCETGVKVYLSSVLTTHLSNNGCTTGQWLCTFYYRWSDGSTSNINAPYSECNSTSCLIE